MRGRFSVFTGVSIVWCVGLLAQAQVGTLTGYWDTSVSLNMAVSSFADSIVLENELFVSYGIDTSSISVLLTHSSTSYSPPSAFLVSASTTIGFASLGSEAHFRVEAGDFNYGIGRIEVNIAGVTLSAVGVLVSNPDDPTPTDLTVLTSLVGQAVNGMVFSLAATFGTYVLPYPLNEARYQASWLNTEETDGICDLPFQRFDAEVTSIAICCATIDATLSFTCSGFETLTLSTWGISVSELPWLLLDATLTYGLESKSFLIAPRLFVGETFCSSQLYFSLGTDEAMLPPHGAVAITPITLEYAYFTCHVREASVKVAAHRGGMLMASLSTTSESCCGSTAMSLHAVFLPTSAALFDLSAIAATLQVVSSERFSWTAVVSYPMASSPQMQIGCQYSW